MDTIFLQRGGTKMEKKNTRFSPLEKHKIMDLKSQGCGYKAIASRLGLNCAKRRCVFDEKTLKDSVKFGIMNCTANI